LSSPAGTAAHAAAGYLAGHGSACTLNFDVRDEQLEIAKLSYDQFDPRKQPVDLVRDRRLRL
jgi:hypothetical protein